MLEVNFHDHVRAPQRREDASCTGRGNSREAGDHPRAGGLPEELERQEDFQSLRSHPAQVLPGRIEERKGTAFGGGLPRWSESSDPCGASSRPLEDLEPGALRVGPPPAPPVKLERGFETERLQGDDNRGPGPQEKRGQLAKQGRVRTFLAVSKRDSDGRLLSLLLIIEEAQQVEDELDGDLVPELEAVHGNDERPPDEAGGEGDLGCPAKPPLLLEGLAPRGPVRLPEAGEERVPSPTLPLAPGPIRPEGPQQRPRIERLARIPGLEIEPEPARLGSHLHLAEEGRLPHARRGSDQERGGRGRRGRRDGEPIQEALNLLELGLSLQEGQQGGGRLHLDAGGASEGPEGRVQLPCRAKAGAGVEGHARENNALEVARQIRTGPRQRAGHRIEGCAVAREASRDHLVEGHAERVNVGPRAGRLVAEALRGEVRQRSLDALDAGASPSLQRPPEEAEVNQDRSPWRVASGDHDVARLDVEVEDPARVEEGDRRRDGVRQREDLVEVLDRPALTERRPRDVVAREIGTTPQVSEVVHAGDARMVDPREERELLLEPLDLRGREHSIFQELEREVLPEVVVAHEEHSPSSSLPELAEGLIARSEIESTQLYS